MAMIKPIEKGDLPACLDIFHRGYETVAEEFGLTEENCPDRGRAGISLDTLTGEFDEGTMMFGYLLNGSLVGFLGMKMRDEGVCKLCDIIVLPEHRQRGYGKELLDFCMKKAAEQGAIKVQLGMIDDNKRLRKWYEKNGFINIGYIKYEKAPFTVGKMEYTLKEDAL